MLLNKIIIKGFKPFQDQIEIDVSNPYQNDQNIALIGAMNGVGKTSLLEAINLCLYGAKNSVIFNWFNKNNALQGKYEIYISLSFDDNGDTIDVSRTYSIPKNTANQNYSDIESVLKVSRNGEFFKESEKAENFLKLKIPKNISQFFFFDGEKIQEIVGDGFSRNDIRESVEALLGIELLKKLYEDLKKVIADERKKYQNISDASIPSREKEVEGLKEKLETVIENIQELKKDIEEREEEKGHLKNIFEERFGKFPDVIEDKKEKEIELKHLKKELYKIDDSLSKFCKENLAVVLLSNFLPDLKDQIRKERAFKDDQRNFEEKNELVNRIIENLFEEECIICKRQVQFDREELFREISDRLFDQPSEDMEIMLDLSEKEEANILNIRAEENYRKIIEFKEKLRQKENFTNRLQTTEKKLGALELEKDDKETFKEIQNKILETEKLLGRRNAEKSDLTDTKKQLEDDISVKERELNRKYETYEKKRDTNRIVEYGRKLNRVIEKYIEIYRTKKVKELEKNLSDIFQRIFAKKLVQKIIINEKTLSITLKTDKNEIIRYKFSAGENEIFAISFLWALSKTSNLELPIIIDTPLARLDHAYREKLIRSYFPFASKQVIILSQNEEIVPGSEFYEILRDSLYLEKTLKYNHLNNKTTVDDGYFVN